MTPEQLDAIESEWAICDCWRPEHEHGRHDVIAALREAWAQVQVLIGDRAEARAALDRVRAVIAPRTAHDCPSCGVLAREVEAAIEGQP